MDPFSPASIDPAPREGLNRALLVIPAQAGIQFFQRIAEELDPSLRWDDALFRGSLAGHGYEACELDATLLFKPDG